MRDINMTCLKNSLARVESPSCADQRIDIVIHKLFAPRAAEPPEGLAEEPLEIITLISKPYVEGRSRWFEWHIEMR